MQTSLFAAEKGKVFPVGMGQGADYDFMDRMARFSGTDEGGTTARGTGDPSEYESILTNIFRDIITKPGSKLVK
jgi:hypothetical protein